MLVAGIGGFLAPTQRSRTFTLEMESYTAEAKPEHEFDDTDVDDLNAVYIFLRHWSARVNLNPKPVMPPGVLRRFADNVRGLLAIADSCGEEWGYLRRLDLPDARWTQYRGASGADSAPTTDE